jgi:DNA-binding transcriptional LysR family regulator
MSSGLSLRSLEVFVAVAETRSMALAAERLKASPSAISQQMSRLEDTLSAQLVDRSARPIALTTAGNRFLPHALKILDGVSAARSEMMELQLSSLPHLRLAIIDDLDVVLTPELVIKLHQMYPRCHVSARSGRSEVHFRALAEREVDIIVTADTKEHDEALERHPLFQEPLILVSAKGAIDAGEDLMAQLAEIPFVRYSEGMPLGRLIELHLRRVRFIPPRSFAFDSSHSVFATVMKCGGWALTTPVCLLDSAQFCEVLEVACTPFPTVGRGVSLWARRGELAGLPKRLAALSREIVEVGCIAPGQARMPWLGDDFRTLLPEESVNQPDAVSPVAGES